MRFESMDEKKEVKQRPQYVMKQEITAVTDQRPYAEPDPEKINLETLQKNMGNCLEIIDEEVMKGYVTKIDQLQIIVPNAEAYSNLKDIHFFRISELVYQEDEFSVDKLAMVFHALSNKPCTLVLMLKSDGEKTDFYLGARPNSDYSAGTLFQMLKQSLLGFFPGSQITEYYDEDMRKDLNALNVGCISSVTSVADYKQQQDMMTNRDFIQGLEKFVYAMHGKVYTAILIADNLSHEQLMYKKREYEQIYTQISPFSNMQMNFMISDGTSESTGNSGGKTSNVSYTNTKGMTENETDTTTRTAGTNKTFGVTVTSSQTDTDSNTHTDTQSNSNGDTHTVGKSKGVTNTIGLNTFVGKNVGISGNAGLHLGPISIGGGVNSGVSGGIGGSVSRGVTHTDSVSDSVTKTLMHGLSDAHGSSYSEGKSHSDSKNYGTNQSNATSKSIGTAINKSDGYTVGESFNLVNTKTITDTFGKSRGITLNAQNMTLNLAMERIKKHLERIEECESFGMWNFAAYFLGETAAETETAASTYKAVIAGTDSGIERNAINSWSNPEKINAILPYIKNFMHPYFVYNGFSYEGDRYVAVNPSALVSTNELAIHMGLPRHSVRGLPVVEHTAFGQEVISRKKTDEEKINLGLIYDMGRKTETGVKLDVNSLAMHTFVTGSTGSGKSNAVYHLLNEIKKKSIPFLVVEPAKGEYKNVFTDVKCYGTNPVMGELLRIDPFSFPKGVHVLEHIDRVVEIFNVCWPMYAAMPAVLKASIENAYRSAGWDLDLSVNEKVDLLFPTFDDVLRELNNLMNESDYSTDTKNDYVGSLSTRLKSLTNGINGLVFVSDEMDLQKLFNENAIIDISRVGAVETKSLIMGLVVLKLQEYRMVNADRMNCPLKHITVLEEAHNLLKKTSTEQSSENANMVGKSVEMLTNAIAEMRTYGEGFMIVDQAPNMLDTAVIRNTNTKIVLKLPESNDREITGGAMALKEKQFDELARLSTGVAAVYQNDWQEAVLCSLPKYESFSNVFTENTEYISFVKRRKNENDILLHLLIKKELTGTEEQDARSRIMKSNITSKVKKDLLLNLNKKNLTYEWAVADFIKKNYDLSDVFRGTGQGNWNTWKELCSIISSNLSSEFIGYSKQEMLKIMYYICRIQHELYPDHQLIEKLRVNYLKEKVN